MKNYFSAVLVSLLVFPSITTSLKAQLGADTRTVITKLDSPTEMLWGPNNKLWVAEKSGTISEIDPGSGVKDELLTIPDVFTSTDAGLFGLALHPDFSNYPYVYVGYSYIRMEPQQWFYLQRIVRYTYDESNKSLSDPVSVVDSLPGGLNNLGGRLLALPDETLLYSIGDGFNYWEESQNHFTLRGKIIRIGMDGKVPADNPWPASLWPLNLIWTTGHQNPKGMAVSPNGDIYSVEWGNTSSGELNVIQKGRNYGWAKVLGYCDRFPFADEPEICADSNMVEPLYQWYRGDIQTVKACDVEYYQAEKIGHWNNSLLVTTLRDGLYQLKFKSDGSRIESASKYFSTGINDLPIGRLRNVCVSPEGRVFVTTSNTGDDDGGLEGFPTENDDQIIEIINADEDTTLASSELITRDVVTGLRNPWEILWGPDNWIWMTERGGRISKVNPETGDKKLLLTVPSVYEFDKQANGMLGMVLHPNFCDTPKVYVVYNYLREGAIFERLVSYEYDSTNETLINSITILDSVVVATDHAGSRLVITPDMKLLMTTGDAGTPSNAQDHTLPSGKILRINLDGTVPDDNPWPANPWPTNLIWTTGHRNPQGLVYAPNGRLYESEHGPNNDDEVNLIEKGRNYGWPNVEGYCDFPLEEIFCADSNIAEPLMAWTPTLAVCGLDYYGHDAIPEWENSLLLVTLKRNHLNQLKLNDEGDSILSSRIYFGYDFGRLRDICIAPDGRVFIATSNHDGIGIPIEGDDRIIEIRSQAGHPPLPDPILCMSDSSNSAVNNVEELQLTVIPHPVKDKSTVQLPRVFGLGTYQIYDITGNQVRSGQIVGGSEFTFTRDALPNGQYVVRISDERGTIRFRVMLLQ